MTILAVLSRRRKADMQAFKVGKLVTFVAIIILLVVAILSPYNLFKIYFILLLVAYFGALWCK